MRRMQFQGVQPTVVSYNALVTVSHLLLQHAGLVGMFTTHHPPPLLQAYAKEGNWQGAEDVLRRILADPHCEPPTTTTYNLVINAYATKGQVSTGLVWLGLGGEGRFSVCLCSLVGCLSFCFCWELGGWLGVCFLGVCVGVLDGWSCACVCWVVGVVCVRVCVCVFLIFFCVACRRPCLASLEARRLVGVRAVCSCWLAGRLAGVRAARTPRWMDRIERPARSLTPPSTHAIPPFLLAPHQALERRRGCAGPHAGEPARNFGTQHDDLQFCYQRLYV